jgi:hypothetical protein
MVVIGGDGLSTQCWQVGSISPNLTPMASRDGTAKNCQSWYCFMIRRSPFIRRDQWPKRRLCNLNLLWQGWRNHVSCTIRRCRSAEFDTS